MRGSRIASPRRVGVARSDGDNDNEAVELLLAEERCDANDEEEKMLAALEEVGLSANPRPSHAVGNVLESHRDSTSVTWLVRDALSWR